MPKSNAFSNDMLKLVFNGVAIANLADNAAVSPLASLYLSFHNEDPGKDGDQTTNEISYPEYTRIPVIRDGTGWVVTVNSVSPANTVAFPEGTGGWGTAKYAAVGTAASGPGKIIYYGALSPNIIYGNGITPRITTDTVITED